VSENLRRLSEMTGLVRKFRKSKCACGREPEGVKNRRSPRCYLFALKLWVH
jgi:hypothetical protein